MMPPLLSTPSYHDVEGLALNHIAYLLILQSAHTKIAQKLSSALQSHANTTIFINDSNHLDADLIQIQHHVDQAFAGLHSIVCGNEAFIWAVQHCLSENGLLKEEISLILDRSPSLTPLKYVYCVHCGSSHTTPQERYCRCPECHIELYIRTHFSMRLGAYMGICANTHQPQGAISV